VNAQALFLHRHPVDCLADDLLSLLERVEAELPPVRDELDKARVDTTKAVINQVYSVIESHLFQGREQEGELTWTACSVTAG
jgi:hypothetical protein